MKRIRPSRYFLILLTNGMTLKISQSSLDKPDLRHVWLNDKVLFPFLDKERTHGIRA